MQQIRWPIFYQQFLSRMLRYMIITENISLQDAEDIVHDLFLKLWEKRDQLDAIESLENYAFIMIRNRLANERRRELIKRNALQYIRECREISANLSEQHILYRELNSAFKCSIRELPQKMKQVFELQNAGAKTETIADRMCISIPVVKNHLRKARKRIRTQIAILHAG